MKRRLKEAGSVFFCDCDSEHVASMLDESKYWPKFSNIHLGLPVRASKCVCLSLVICKVSIDG